MIHMHIENIEIKNIQLRNTIVFYLLQTNI